MDNLVEQYSRLLEERNAFAARLAEAEEKRAAQLRQQGEAWAADAARKDARLAEAEALLREARDYWQPERIDAFFMPADQPPAFMTNAEAERMLREAGVCPLTGEAASKSSATPDRENERG